jgi:AP-2 complex subunit alpha
MFPPPEQGTIDLRKINDIVGEIMSKTEVTKNVNKNNSDHSILFEAINLVIHYKNSAQE